VESSKKAGREVIQRVSGAIKEQAEKSSKEQTEKQSKGNRE
jgi:hypothetical protein